MPDQGFTNGLPGPAYHVEHSRRQVGFIQNVCEDKSCLRRNLRGLQHDGAAGSNRRYYLQNDLMQRVVPGRNTANHPDWRILHFRVTRLLNERKLRQHIGIGLGYSCRQTSLDCRGKLQWHAHFPADRFRNFRCPLLESSMQLAKHVHPLLYRTFRPDLKCCMRSGNCQLHLSRIGHGHPGNHVAGGRFMHIRHVAVPVDPATIDVVLVQNLHVFPSVEDNHATRVLARDHVVKGLNSFIYGVSLGDQLIEFKFTRTVQTQKSREIVLRPG